MTEEGPNDPEPPSPNSEQQPQDPQRAGERCETDDRSVDRSGAAAATTESDDLEKDGVVVEMTTVRLADGLGRLGVYTGSVDPHRHLPCRTGVMVYEQDPVVAKFDGAWENGRWKAGQLMYKSGDVYEGGFDESGLKTGRGTYNFADDGRIYQGGFVRDKMHGRGCLTWLDGQVYDGDFYENSRQGSGVFEAPAEGAKYQGSFYRGVYHGYGIYQSSDQSVYRGNFEDGQPHGHGVMVDRDGTVVHEGEWEEGRPRKPAADGEASSALQTSSKQDLPPSPDTGPGGNIVERQPTRPLQPPTVSVVHNHVWQSGRGRATYRGLWNVNHDCPTGNGTVEYDDGTTYEGFFDLHGSWHGKGRWSSSNGDAYDGAFVSGERHGYGIYTWSDGRQYQGNFEHNVRQGRGVLVYANNDLYEGDFVRGMRHGRGRFVFANGAVYQGEWQGGLYHGRGKLVQNDGRIYEGYFREGQAHGRGKEIDSNGKTIHDGFWKTGKPYSDDEGDVSDGEPLSLSDELAADHSEQDISQLKSDEDVDRLEPACPPPASAPPVPPYPPPESAPLPSAFVPPESAPPAPPSETLPMSPPLKPPTAANHIDSGSSTSAERLQMAEYENCKAVVDQPLRDAQGNPGRYTGIVSIHLLDTRGLSNDEGASSPTLVLKPHGVGRMVYADGLRIHEGFWRHGNKHGHGRCLFFPQGDWHEGEYADNNRHGHGRYQWKDGRVYEGNYAHDLRDGQGMFTFRSKDVYTGSFVKGKCSGYGRVEFVGRRGYYEGEWNGGKYHGKGTLRQRCETSNGASGNNEVFVVYEGEFASGKLHGFGKKTCPDGTVEEGYWHDGVFCGDEQGMRAENAGAATILQPPDESSERSDDPPYMTSDQEVLDRESAALNESIVTLSVSIPSDDRAASASGYTV